MSTGRHVTSRNGTGGHNNIPVSPADNQTQYGRARKGCLPAIIGLCTLIPVLIIVGIFASAHFFIPWWVESQTGHYTAFNSRALAGTITSSKTEQSNMSQFSLITTVDGGALKLDSTYLLRCEEWRLDADILTITPWINTPAHSLFQLTSIEGSQCLDQHGKAQILKPAGITGSDDNFGENVLKGEGFGIVSAKEITSNFMPVDGKSYQVIVTSNTLLRIAYAN
jgi:hypothetical protein